MSTFMIMTAEGDDVDRGVRIYLVADDESTELGNIAIRPRHWADDPSPTPYAEITHLWVAESHRRRGVGRKLVSLAFEWAAAQGFERVSVESTAREDAAAVALYAELGFGRCSIVWDRKVGS